MVEAFAEAELALAAAIDTPPAAILARHVQRAPMDGIELTRRVRAEQAIRDVAVVVITTRIEAAYAAAAVDAGCDGFLGLPARTNGRGLRLQPVDRLGTKDALTLLGCPIPDSCRLLQRC